MTLAFVMIWHTTHMLFVPQKRLYEACLLLLVLRDSRSCYARNVSFIVDLARILGELASKKFLC